MAFDEKFRFIFDVTGDKAAAKSFADVGKAADRAGLATAEAGKTGARSFGQMATAAAPYVAAAGAAAAVAYKLVMQFQNLAIAAGKLALATGLTTEQASRWLEVGGDVGIGADTLTTAFSKMDVALSKTPGKFAALGIEIAHTKTGAVDVNETFLRVIAVLNGITDPMKRAEAAAAIFGKGFAGMAELTGQSADELREKLAAVSDQKVITDSEYKKAVKFRETMDDLKDSFEDVALKVGQMFQPVLEALAPILEAVAVDIGLVADAIQWVVGLFGDAKDEVDEIPASLGAAGQAWLDHKRQLEANAVAWEEMKIQNRISEMNGATDASYEYARSAKAEAAAIEAAATATKHAADAAKLANEQWSALLGLFDNEQAALNITKTAAELTKAAKRHQLDPADVLNFKSTTGAQFQKLGMSERTFRLTVLPIIDMGEYTHVAKLLDAMTRMRNAPFEPILTSTSKPGKKLVDGEKESATGGLVDSAGSFVGERGAEWFQPSSAGRIFTSGELARAMNSGGGGGTTIVANVTVNAGMGASGPELGRQVAEVLRQYERQAGAGWRN